MVSGTLRRGLCCDVTANEMEEDLFLCKLMFSSESVVWGSLIKHNHALNLTV